MSTEHASVGVTFTGVERHFGDVAALAGLDLDIAPGELIALLGPSGCGKTTALRLLGGYDRPTAGTITVGERDITRIPTNKRDIGMVFQAYSLFPNMDVRANVAFGLRMRRQAKDARRKRAGDLLELVGLADAADRYPHQLSGGQQQRVALARALAIEPTVLLLDEPLSALDALVRHQLRDEIRAIQRRTGTTTMFVTHDQQEALSIADRVGVMRAGRLEQIDAPEVVYARPATAFVAEFVGAMNHVAGTLATAGRVRVLGREIAAELDGEPPASGIVEVLLRPESIGVDATPDGEAEVLERTFLGSSTRLRVRANGAGELLAELPGHAHGLGPGARVAVSVLVDVALVAAPRVAAEAAAAAEA
jgi:putative spermidine/putrescine transport system ATP-binding protein